MHIIVARKKKCKNVITYTLSLTKETVAIKYAPMSFLIYLSGKHEENKHEFSDSTY